MFTANIQFFFFYINIVINFYYFYEEKFESLCTRHRLLSYLAALTFLIERLMLQTKPRKTRNPLKFSFVFRGK